MQRADSYSPTKFGKGKNRFRLNDIKRSALKFEDSGGFNLASLNDSKQSMDDEIHSATKKQAGSKRD